MACAWSARNSPVFWFRCSGSPESGWRHLDLALTPALSIIEYYGKSAAYKRALERDLNAILASATDCPLAPAQMLTVCYFAGNIDANNNVSVRVLRPSANQRESLTVNAPFAT